MLPDSMRLSYMSDTIVTKDGFKLCSWTIEPATKNENNNITILFCYQDMGNMSYVLYNALPFSLAGFQVVMFDYRGFGGSQDFKIDESNLFYKEYVIDFNAALDYVKTKYKNNRIGVWSASMGTIIATLSDHTYDFLIADSYITNPYFVAEVLLKSKQKEIHIPVTSKEYETKLSNNNIHKLIFIGNEDPVIDSPLLDKIKNKEVIIYNGGHLQGMQIMTEKVYGDLYVAKVEAFLKNNK